MVIGTLRQPAGEGPGGATMETKPGKVPIRRLLVLVLSISVAMILPSMVQAQDGTPQQGTNAVGSQPNAAQPAAMPALQSLAGGNVPSSATPSGNARISQNSVLMSEAAPDYIIGPEDVLNISVFNVPELSQTVRVANDGTIPVLLLGEVRAAGLTAEQLQQKLRQLYGKTYLQHPIVSVYVSQFNAEQVSIVGAVSRPGMYPLLGKRTLIQMLSLAGFGNQTTTTPHGRTVLITRPGGFGNLQLADGMKLLSPDKLQINIDKLLYSGHDALNIQIQPNDIISVSKAAIVYVTGRGVTKPGGFVLQNQSNLTVLQAIAMAEGLSANAAAKRSYIIHTRPDGSHVEIPVNVIRIERGKAPDPLLEANDILWVPNSAEKAGLKAAAASVVGTLSGLLIYGKL